jgi:hypothetical protein
MATGFSGLGLGELGAESKYVGKSSTFYKPPEVRNEKGEVQVPLLQGLRQMASKYLGDKYVTPGVNWLENKLSPVPPPAAAPIGVSPAAPVVLAAPVDANADHPALEGLLKTDPFNP